MRNSKRTVKMELAVGVKGEDRLITAVRVNGRLVRMDNAAMCELCRVLQREMDRMGVK